MKRTPLNRGTKRVRQVNRERAIENAEYLKAKKQYLRTHPLCQYVIAQLGFREDLVMAACDLEPGAAVSWVLYLGQHIPASSDLHHRNGRMGKRLLDQRFWLAVSRQAHDMIHQSPSQARTEGFLLPVQADPNGRWGSGYQALPTPELMKSKIRP